MAGCAEATDDKFGWAVSIDGDTALVGAPTDDTGALNSGSAYVFVRAGTTWTQQAKLTPSQPINKAEFGYAVSVKGDTALVGTYNDSLTGSGAGSASVFARSGTTWKLEQKLTANDALASNWFGHSVSLDRVQVSASPATYRTTALIGAPGHTSISVATRSAYVFARSGTSWSQLQKLTAKAPASWEKFGAAVSLSGHIGMIGDWRHKSYGQLDSGSVTFASPLLQLANGAMCAEDGFCKSKYCVDGVCCENACDNGKPAEAGTDCLACANKLTGFADGKCVSIPASAGFVCRGSAGLCDMDEKCTGTSGTCPPNGFKPSTLLCRKAVDAKCDQDDYCSGTAAACKDSYKASCACRPAAGLCDIPEMFSQGKPCGQDEWHPAGTTCRKESGACDIAEACTGTSTACPADNWVGKGSTSSVVCRAAAGPCDIAEICDGKNKACPSDKLLPATHVCRLSSGQCDLPDKCDGLVAACPMDRYELAGNTCRASTGICDLEETCDGASKKCPADALVKAGTVCRPMAHKECDIAETCSGAATTCPVDKVKNEKGSCEKSTGTCWSGDCRPNNSPASNYSQQFPYDPGPMNPGPFKYSP